MIGVVTVLVNTDTPVMVGDTITLTINLLRHSASAYLICTPSFLLWLVFRIGFSSLLLFRKSSF